MNTLNHFEWEDFLSFCQEIQNKKYFLAEYPNINEAIKRTVISRAYYSVYNTVSEFLDYNPKKGEDSHNGLLDILQTKSNNLKEPNFKTIHDILSNLKDARAKSDYNKEQLKYSPNSTIKNAIKVFELLKQIKDNS